MDKIESLLDKSLEDLTAMINGAQQNASWGAGTFQGKRATVPRVAVARYPFDYAGIVVCTSASTLAQGTAIGPINTDIASFSVPQNAPYFLGYADLLIQGTGVTPGVVDQVQGSFRLGDTPTGVSAVWFKRFFCVAKAGAADSAQVFLRENQFLTPVFQNCDLTGPVVTATFTAELILNFHGIKIDWK